jgi:hypothetical protein
MVSMDKAVIDIIREMMTTNSTKDGSGFGVFKFKVRYLVFLFKKGDGSSKYIRGHI